MTGAQEHGIFESEGGEGGVAAAETGCEGETQVGGADEPRCGQAAEEAHEETAAKVDDESVPGHGCGCDSPSGADVVAGEVTKHAAGKTAAAYAEQSLEGENHGGAEVRSARCEVSPGVV